MLNAAASGRPLYFGILVLIMLGKRNVFLIGPMGSGKTAVGKQLARLLKMSFLDSDAEIEKRTGVDIPYIFEKEGEAGFRQRESEAIDALTQQGPLVLATGGGAILRPENREHLKERGTVVYLQTSIHQQVQRTRRSRNRPLLVGVDLRSRIEQLMRDRAALYESAADITVSTDSCKVRSVAEEIIRQLEAAATNP